MAATNDTIDGLLAEFRGYSHGMPPSYHVTMSWADFRKMLDRFEKAYKREREAITPKSDPDWKDICAKCKDGDIEPNYCEYYGEPNGCNSPIYGEHPTAKKSLVVGDCAKLREAVGYILKYADSVACRDHDEHTRHYIDQIRKWAQSALAAPPRNCDIAQDWLHDLYVNFKPPASVKREMPPEWVDAVMAFCRWLVAPATEKEGGVK